MCHRARPLTHRRNAYTHDRLEFDHAISPVEALEALLVEINLASLCSPAVPIPIAGMILRALMDTSYDHEEYARSLDARQRATSS